MMVVVQLNWLRPHSVFVRLVDELIHLLVIFFPQLHVLPYYEVELHEIDELIQMRRRYRRKNVRKRWRMEIGRRRREKKMH